MTAVIKTPRTARTMPLRELTGATATPIAVVRANLMPPQVAGKRRLTWLRRRLAVALIALVALVGAGYAWTTQETSSSQDDLAAEQQQTAQLNQRVRQFDALLALQAQTSQIRTQLGSVMATDVQWSAILHKLAAAAPRGLTVVGITAKTTDPSAAPGAGTDTASGPQLPPNVKAIGQLQLSGAARDYRTVASYIDRLAGTPGFAGVQPAAVTSAAGVTTYTISLVLTSDVLGGRFTPKAGK